MPYILYPKKLHGSTQKFGEDFAKQLLAKLENPHGITLESGNDIESEQMDLLTETISEIFRESYYVHEKLLELKPKEKGDDQEPEKDANEEYEALEQHIQKVENSVNEMLKFCKTANGGIDLTQLAYSIVSGYFPNLEAEVYAEEAKKMTELQEIGEYKEDDTPFDWYDSQCHLRNDTCTQWFNSPTPEIFIEDPDRFMFFVNLSEQAKRPKDMFMFLGEYFKNHISLTRQIAQNIDKKKEDGEEKDEVDEGLSSITTLDQFYLTHEVMNSLGIASKLLVDNLRQELRISIALSRSPKFQAPEDIPITLQDNIRETQLKLIKECSNIYKYIDYLHDAKQIVPLANLQRQPPKSILNAIFYKMKADYMRFIYECLSGDSGLLYGQKKKVDVKEIQERRKANDINKEESTMFQEDFQDYTKDRNKMTGALDDEVRGIIRGIDGGTGQDGQCTSEDAASVLEFFKQETYNEYEKAKRCIIVDNPNLNGLSLATLKTENGINEYLTSPFHPVYMSSLLNQQVFKRDCIMQEFKEIQRHRSLTIKNNQKDMTVLNSIKKEFNVYIIKTIQDNLDFFDSSAIFSDLKTEDKNTAENYYEILEKMQSSWEKDKMEF